MRERARERTRESPFKWECMYINIITNIVWKIGTFLYRIYIVHDLIARWCAWIWIMTGRCGHKRARPQQNPWTKHGIMMIIVYIYIDLQIDRIVCAHFILFRLFVCVFSHSKMFFSSFLLFHFVSCCVLLLYVYIYIAFLVLQRVIVVAHNDCHATSSVYIESVVVCEKKNWCHDKQFLVISGVWWMRLSLYVSPFNCSTKLIANAVKTYERMNINYL